MLNFATENNKYTKQWEHTFTKKSPATREASGKDTHQTTSLPTFWQVLTRTICILNLWTNIIAFRPHSGIVSISILRGYRISPASVIFRLIIFRLWKQRLSQLFALSLAHWLFSFLSLRKHPPQECKSSGVVLGSLSFGSAQKALRNMWTMNNNF